MKNYNQRPTLMNLIKKTTIGKNQIMMEERSEECDKPYIITITEFVDGTPITMVEAYRLRASADFSYDNWTKNQLK